MDVNATLNILIPSAGGLSGTFLIRHLSHQAIEHYRYRIVAADSNRHTVVRRLASAFYQVPACHDPDYERAILEIILKENIDIIFPVASYDTPFFAQRKARLEQMGVQLLVCDMSTHERLHNKKTMYETMRTIGIPVPRYYGPHPPLFYPAIIKPAASSGSKNVCKLENDGDYRYWSSKLKEYVVTDFIEGTEYTVDCLFDKSNRLVLSNVRERVKMNGGAVVITRQAESAAVLTSILQKIEAHLKIEGPVNFQYIADRENRLFLTDFNTRFASGGLPLTVAAGYDIPNLMIRIMLNQPVDVSDVVPPKGLTMYRYYQEWITEEP
ncbi:ATP-grasp domain-containing protein [Paenibacillus macerans]|uniref:ATP-grasp domain-containing protein n=1 Tax=Paenibacillus macerans TaxID=44252 RepID=UPI002DB70F61|nr:ATP-grasp domain-containing protein [Paenibacillus macerans]MEC0331603.1 ATP-grasp domain-containing protein [Paenibacillus macerans]